MDYQPLTPPTGGPTPMPEPAPAPMPSGPLTAAAPTPSMHLPTEGRFSSGGGGSSPIMVVLIVILALGTLAFGLMAVAESGAASSAAKKLNTQVAAAAAQAKNDQKKLDDQANAIAAESPFRSYIAPVSDGSFEIKFPKDWSGYVDEEQAGVQVSLTLNPDFVRRSNGQDELSATYVELLNRSSEQVVQQFSGMVKSGNLHQNAITISGQQGIDFTGDFHDNRTTREVVVPVRDKVILFVNENGKYANEFSEILAQAKIIP